MATSAPHVVRLHTADSRCIRRVGIAAVLAGLLLVPVTGLIGRMVVAHQGQSVVSWETGISIAWRATLVAVLPWFLFLAWLATHSLRLALDKDRHGFPVQQAGWIGALAGQIISFAWLLLVLWSDTHFLGINMLLGVPMGLLLTSLPAVAGALLGGIAGLWIGRALTHRL